LGAADYLGEDWHIERHIGLENLLGMGKELRKAISRSTGIGEEDP